MRHAGYENRATRDLTLRVLRVESAPRRSLGRGRITSTSQNSRLSCVSWINTRTMAARASICDGGGVTGARARPAELAVVTTEVPSLALTLSARLAYWQVRSPSRSDERNRFRAMQTRGRGYRFPACPGHV